MNWDKAVRNWKQLKKKFKENLDFIDADSDKIVRKRNQLIKRLEEEYDTAQEKRKSKLYDFDSHLTRI